MCGFSTPRRVSRDPLVSKRNELGRATARSQVTFRRRNAERNRTWLCYGTQFRNRSEELKLSWSMWIFLIPGGFHHKQLECRNETNLVVLWHAVPVSFRRDRINTEETSRVEAQMQSYAGAHREEHRSR